MLYEFRSDNLDSMELVRKNFENVVEEFRKKGLQVNVEIMGERPCGRKNSDNPHRKSFPLNAETLLLHIISVYLDLPRPLRTAIFHSSSGFQQLPLAFAWEEKLIPDRSGSIQKV